MTSLEDMRRELKAKFERLKKREQARRETMLRYYEPLPSPPPLVPRREELLPKRRRGSSNSDEIRMREVRRLVIEQEKKGFTIGEALERLVMWETITEDEARQIEEERAKVWKDSSLPLFQSWKSNPNDLEFLIGAKGETGLERIMNRVRTLAEYGKDPEAEKLMTKLGAAMMMMSARDFWNYLYDWTQDAIKLLKARKVAVPTPAYAWTRRIR